jgi:hypothetical protein
MNINNLKVELDIREDSNGAIYHLGRLRTPCKIDLTNGATFLIFISASGEEELQIACNDKENATFNKYTKQRDRLKVAIEDREDQHEEIFYVAKLQYNGYIDCGAGDGVVFIVFTSKEGSEELQIVGKIVSNNDKNIPAKRQGIEVIYKT